MTARAIGSGGLEVFGTPFMMAMMEHAAMDCVQPDLPEGKGTVGVDIQSSHLAPTPVGMTVRATATVTGVSETGSSSPSGWRPATTGPHRRGDPHPGHHRQRPLPAEVQQQADGAEITPAASKEGGERRSPPSFAMPAKKLSRPFKSSCNQRTGTV